jgi:hypothetical protein
MQVETRRFMSGRRCQVSGLTRGARHIRRRMLVARINFGAGAAPIAPCDAIEREMFGRLTLGYMIGSLQVPET